MHASSSTRLRTAFVPWLAALIIGASAHAGWLIHEYRSAASHLPVIETRVRIDVEVPAELDSATKRSDDEAARLLERARAREARRARAVERAQQLRARASDDLAPAPRPACRQLAFEAPVEQQELAAWIEQTGSHEYQVDRRLFEQIDAAIEHESDPIVRLAQLIGLRGAMLQLGQAQGTMSSGKVELRNIRAFTPLWQLGLRNGDRPLALVDEEGTNETYILAVKRSGQTVVLTYRLV